MLERFFEANQPITYFAYGLALFLMGFAAALGARAYRVSRLALARSLPWLAAFGMLAGSAEWGVVFIPMQSSYLAPPGIAALHSLHAIVMLAGHGCLLLFGIRLLREWEPVGVRVAVAMGMGLTAFGLWTAGKVAVSGWSALLWPQVAYPLAAYGLALPGAILAARGLVRQSRDVAPFYPRPARWLLVAAWAFILSIPLGPLAVSTVGDGTLLYGVPVQVPLIVGSLLLVGSLLAGLEVLGVEHARRLERAERREVAMEERYLLGKELNDGVIQDLFAAGLLLGVATMDLSAEKQKEIRTVELQLQMTVDRLRSYILDLNPVDWEQPDLYLGLHQLVNDFRANTLLPIDLDVEPGLVVTSGVVRELYVVAHEALSNIRRHSGATLASVSLRRSNDSILFVIVDNGRGMLPETMRGTGLERMHRSAADIGGSLITEPAPGGGTRVFLCVPNHFDGNTK